MSITQSRAPFECARVNSTTFVIKENDQYGEYPFIYVKLYNEPPLAVLSDTGCGGSSEGQAGKHEYRHHDLKSFIETTPVSSNNNQPLNSSLGSGKPVRKYLIICTHCHYDHILGIEAFQDAEIVASGQDKAFVQRDLLEHSLCKYIPVPVPEYHVSRWAAHREWLHFDGKSLNLEILHTPGHTPDELAWYDKDERHLFVGDSLYERVAEDKSYEQAIIFPKEGSFIDYIHTLIMLLAFIEAKNAERAETPLRMGCGHVTASTDAREMIVGVQRLFQAILAGEVPIVRREEKRGEEFVTWKEDGEPTFSVAAPLRLFLDAKGHFYSLSND